MPCLSVFEDDLENAVLAPAREIEGALTILEREAVRDEPLRTETRNRVPRKADAARFSPPRRKLRVYGAHLA